MAKCDYDPIVRDERRPSVVSAPTSGGVCRIEESKAKKLCESIVSATSDKDAKAFAEMVLPENSEMLALGVIAILRGSGFSAVVSDADERRSLAMDVLCGKAQIHPVAGWFASGHVTIDEVFTDKDLAKSYVDQLNEASGTPSVKVVQRALWKVSDKTAIVAVEDFPVVARYLTSSVS